MTGALLRRLALGAVLATFAAWGQGASHIVVSSAPGRAAPPSAREQQFARLVSERARAIDLAFGEAFAPRMTELRIAFVKAEKWDDAYPSGVTHYDPEARTLYFARRLLFAESPTTTFSAKQYWPWYDKSVRGLYPIVPLVQVIDAALWSAVMQDAARERNLEWPHAQCGSFDVAERLPCEMLLSGVAAHTTQVTAQLFNENRISQIWPEDIAELRVRSWSANSRAYQDVREYGGYLLLRPLVREFGVVRTLSYVAGTPFHLEQNNVRLSAERYQRRAREALTW